MLVPDPRLLVPLGDLDPRDAAPLSDAALTPYHAIKLALHQLVPGTSAVVIGVGGLGHMAVQILRALSPARVIATDIDAGQARARPSTSARITRSASGEHAAAEIRELTGGRGAALVLDCVGSDATLALDAQVVAKGGAVMVIGVGRRHAASTASTRCRPTRASPTRTGAASIELAEVLELARAGRITAHAEHFPLERVTDAYERMRDGTLSGRAVITPHG